MGWDGGEESWVLLFVIDSSQGVSYSKNLIQNTQHVIAMDITKSLGAGMASADIQSQALPSLDTETFHMTCPTKRKWPVYSLNFVCFSRVFLLKS